MVQELIEHLAKLRRFCGVRFASQKGCTGVGPSECLFKRLLMLRKAITL
jgi:hypothetical protein